MSNTDWLAEYCDTQRQLAEAFAERVLLATIQARGPSPIITEDDAKRALAIGKIVHPQPEQR